MSSTRNVLRPTLQTSASRSGARGKALSIPALSLCLSFCLSFSFVGCSTTPSDTQSPVDKAQAATSAAAGQGLTSDGLEMVESTRSKRLWVKPDHHIGRYDNVLITGIGFAYQKGQERLNPSQEAELGRMLQEAIGGITKDSPVGQVAEPGPCVVALQVGLRDIKLHMSDQQPGSSISFVSSFGSATMIVEFRDSTTEVPLLRYAVHRGLGGGPGTGRIGANLGRLGQILGEMVTGMTTELSTIVPSTTVRPETECNDGIYALTGRG